MQQNTNNEIRMMRENCKLSEREEKQEGEERGLTTSYSKLCNFDLYIEKLRLNTTKKDRHRQTDIKTRFGTKIDRKTERHR